MPHWHKIVRSLAWVALILVLTRIGLQVAIMSVTQPAASAGAVPSARFDVLEKTVLVGTHDTQVQAQFALHNAGQRRLVVRQLRRACCYGDVSWTSPIWIAGSPTLSATCTMYVERPE